MLHRTALTMSSLSNLQPRHREEAVVMGGHVAGREVQEGLLAGSPCVLS